MILRSLAQDNCDLGDHVFEKRSHCGFDLAKLNSVAADFDLLVDAADELDRTVLTTSDQVASPVHAHARFFPSINKRTCDEPLGGQAWPACVATSQAIPCNVELTWHALWHWIQKWIKHEQGGIPDGMTNGGSLILVLRTTLPTCHIQRGFRWPIKVPKLDSGKLRESVVLYPPADSFSATQYLLETGALTLFKVLQEQFQHGWNKVDGCNALLLNHSNQVACVRLSTWLGNGDPCPTHQGKHPLPKRNVKRRRSFLEHVVLRGQANCLVAPKHVACRAEVGDCDAFGCPGGS